MWQETHKKKSAQFYQIQNKLQNWKTISIAKVANICDQVFTKGSK
jgi:hypothetical protein